MCQASKPYFSEVESSPSIRETEETLRALVRKHWKSLENANAAILGVLGTALADLAELAPYSDAAILEVVDALRNRKQDARSLREAEYRTAPSATPPTSLPVTPPRRRARRGLWTGLSRRPGRRS